MDLSDNQKLIVSTLCIQKQLSIKTNMYERVQQVKDYAKSLNVNFPVDIYQNITSEELNFITCLQTHTNGLVVYNQNASDFDEETKFCVYATEMILIQGDLPVEVAKELEGMFRKVLNISEEKLDELLEAIVAHLDITISYITYWINKDLDSQIEK